VGIPPEERSHIFEPFFTTKRDVGTGLGLWVCKTIVGNHQGSIRIHSARTPGKSGTAVSIFLPLNFADDSGSQTQSLPRDALPKAS
jgi:signal transduction histidine kinase